MAKLNVENGTDIYHTCDVCGTKGYMDTIELADAVADDEANGVAVGCANPDCTAIYRLSEEFIERLREADPEYGP